MPSKQQNETKPNDEQEFVFRARKGTVPKV